MRASFGHIISFTAGAVLTAGLLVNSAQRSVDEPSSSPVRAAMQNAPAQPTHIRQHDRDLRRAERTKHLPSHETVECCLEVAQDIDQHLAERLREQHTQNPDAFAVQLQFNGQRLLDLCELRSEDPALYNAKLVEMRWDAKVVEMAQALRAARDDGNQRQVVQLEDELKQVLRFQLAFEIQSRAEFLLKLEQEVQRLRNELEAMGSQFNETVATRFAELRNTNQPTRPSWQQRSRVIVPTETPEIPPE